MWLASNMSPKHLALTLKQLTDVQQPAIQVHINPELYDQDCIPRASQVAPQAGAPRPVAWFHLFNAEEQSDFRKVRAAAGRSPSDVLSQARKASL